MLLNNVTLLETGETSNIETDGDLIKYVGTNAITDNKLSVMFDNAIAFPGLINSHDHLDFNLYPQLGDRYYRNYTEWGNYIHQHYKPQIDKILKIPLELRERWGLIKNLLGGVTTVVNHGNLVQTNYRPINVFEDYQCIHSVQFDSKWKTKLTNPLKSNFPVVIHIGEGKDEAAHKEIDDVLKWNYLRKRLIGVHGVAMNEEQARKFDALVWCSQSNYFLLDRTADIKRLKNATNILFGTDSTLTSTWDIWEHIKLARTTELLSDIELYKALTINAANAWKLNNKGLLSGQKADLVIAKKKEADPLNAFFAVNPEDILLVVVNGEIKLLDGTLSLQMEQSVLSNYDVITLNGTVKYINSNVTALVEQLKSYYPESPIPFSINQIIDHA